MELHITPQLKQAAQASEPLQRYLDRLPLNRKSMVPRPWGTLNPLSRWVEEATRAFEQRAVRRKGLLPPKEAPFVEDTLDLPDAPDPHGYWQHNGNVRRVVLLILMLMLALFALLFCWVSAGFWTAMTGFLVLMRGDDPYLIAHGVAGPKWISPDARTAIVMQSVLRHGDLDRFAFFVLSDSGESDICAAEKQAWASLCKEVSGFGRIFYRHRRRRVKRKSGNIDDFCRRWGADYRYMLVLDADSVVSGECLSTLVRLMEAHPGAGIIQTAPRAAGRDTLYARIQQFSTRVYGPLFTAGLHYWQLGESHYWGHNSIIRLAPFIKHCALAPLPGEDNLSGPILLHDFVEASLMRRAGWSVWIAYDLDGSYEEMLPNLLDELSRDCRWCQGNLMNFRLFLARGMRVVHRAVFVTGVMAYLSAPLWALFLALSTVLLATHTLIDPTYFVESRQLFPIWSEWHPEKALALVSAIATIIGWGEALRRHGMHSLLGVAWGALVYWLNPAFIWWLMPIAGSLALSVPLSVLSSRVSFGRSRLFSIPEEVYAPRELRDTVNYLNATAPLPGFIDVVVDPSVNALICATSHGHPRMLTASRSAGDSLVLQALRRGPSVLTEKQKHILLDDPRLLSALHLAVWSQPGGHSSWLVAK